MALELASYLYGTHAYFFRDGDSSSSIIATASRERTSNVATVVTGSAHGLWVGASVTVAGLGGVSYNATATVIAVPTSTSFTYANTAVNEGTTTDTGGTVTLAGTASTTFRPGPADADWISLGSIEEASDSLEETEIELYRPTPGRLRLKDVLSTKDKLMIKITTNEWGPFHNEVLYRSGELDETSTQFNPLEGRAKKGWLKIQRYDQDDELRLVMDVYSRLKISGDVAFGGSDIIKPEFEILVLHSTLNTASL